MTIRSRLPVLALVGLTSLAAAPALADGPGPAPAPYYDRGWSRSDEVVIVERARRPARRVTGGPGYVGSDYGLGKPSFYGIGSRPDWGRSSADD